MMKYIENIKSKVAALCKAHPSIITFSVGFILGALIF